MPDRITTARADKIEAQYRAKQRARRLGKPPPDSESDTEEDDAPAAAAAPLFSVTPAPKAPKKAAAPKKKTPAPRKKKEAAAPAPSVNFADMFDDLPGRAAEYAGDAMGWGQPQPSEEEIAQMEAEYARAAEIATKINLYYKRFPALLPAHVKAKQWSVQDPIEDLVAEHARIRTMLGMKGSEAATRMVFLGAVQTFEYVTVEKDFNPFGIRARGLTAACAAECARKDSEMGDALAEIGIEYMRSIGPELRLLGAFAGVVAEYNRRGDAPPPPVPATVEAAVAAAEKRKRAPPPKKVAAEAAPPAAQFNFGELFE